jgi:glyoxylase-like metal-dependent hydrolase (beta-lactamase superfamily II)
VAHTHGDGFAWLPKEKILFTGDAAVNGPYNYMGDGDSGAWVVTLAKAQELGATVVAPGHGPSGDAKVLDRQRRFFAALRAEVEKRKGQAPDRVLADVPAIREALLKEHSTYIETDPKKIGGFRSQVGQVYKELTGKEFPNKVMEQARRAHGRHHAVGAF